jgi:DNA-binding response OmpR family regulator
MILCLSHDDAKLASLDQTLRDAHHDVFSAVNVHDALKLLSYQPVKVIIADDILTTPEGRSIQSKARSFHPRIPVLYWTASTASEDPSNTISEIDADVVLSRANGIEELLSILSILIRE